MNATCSQEATFPEGRSQFSVIRSSHQVQALSRIHHMGKLHNPADYNLTANPSLPKTNSPWRLWALLILCAVVILVLSEFFSPDIRLARPILTISAGQMTATTRATNRTAATITLDIRFRVGTMGADSRFESGQFLPLAQQDVSATVPPHSTEAVSCLFSLPDGKIATYGEAQILTER